MQRETNFVNLPFHPHEESERGKRVEMEDRQKTTTRSKLYRPNEELGKLRDKIRKNSVKMKDLEKARCLENEELRRSTK